MAVQAYINFNGNCREAVAFYAEVFKAEKQQIMTFGDAHGSDEFPLPEEAKKLVMHTYLNICGSKVMFSDSFPGMPYTVGNNISLAVVIKDIEEIKAIFNGLKEGGTIGMELQETFWSKCYGTVTDKYGVLWQVSHEAEAN